MRAVLAVLALAVAASGCAELGVVTDGSSISYGKPNRGRLIDGQKLPDSGPGYVVPLTWKTRGARYGTNELISLIKGTSKRMRKKIKDARVVVADLSANNGGEARKWHKSHQSGRDVDVLYYVRDSNGKAIEPELMHAFDGNMKSRDGSGNTLDVARTWMIVRDLLTAQEAYVQYIFMYRPIAEKLIEYATNNKESDVVIERAKLALKQPAGSAPHDDHFHVRIYCSQTDRMFGCQDIGPLELLAAREAETQRTLDAIAKALPPASPDEDEGDAPITVAVAPTPIGPTVAVADDDETPEKTAADVWAETPPPSTAASILPTGSFSALVRASSHRIDLRAWR